MKMKRDGREETNALKSKVALSVVDGETLAKLGVVEGIKSWAKDDEGQLDKVGIVGIRELLPVRVRRVLSIPLQSINQSIMLANLSCCLSFERKKMNLAPDRPNREGTIISKEELVSGDLEGVFC